MKRPAFQFYPVEWLTDVELQSCTIGARGLWAQLMCVMHSCKPYGHLALNGEPMEDTAAAQHCKVELRDFRRLLAELEKHGVPSRNADGILYSRRMVKDERLRNIRAESGKQGGNPNLLNQSANQKDNQSANQTGKQSPTPSSAVAFASSTASKTEPLVVVPTVAEKLSTADPQQHVNGTVSKSPRAKTENWKDPAWLSATAQTLGLTRHPQQSDDEWQDRVISTLNVRRAEGRT